MKYLNILLHLILVASLLPFSALSQTTQQFIDHEQIRQQAKHFLISKTKEMNFNDTQIEVGRIDRRLRLASCASALDISLGHSRLPGNVSLAVQCHTGKSWKIYIQASVSAFQDIYVARSPIQRGTSIRQADISLERRDITTLNGNYLANAQQIKPYVAKRNIRKGEIIKPFMLVKSKLIKRGEQVTLIAETSGITVRMMGQALNDATAGQQVRVRNNNSKRVVEGTALSRGIVQINM